MSGKIKTNVFLIKKQPYSESSVLMQVFSDVLGMISVLAKGLSRSKQHQDFLLNVLNEYEFVITNAPNAGIHTLIEFSLINEYPTDLPLETWITAQAGVEILSKVILPEEDTSGFYHALKKYLEYQKNVTNNPITIFWRYLLHLYKLLGIPINLSKCSCCNHEMEKPAGYSADNGQLICSACFPATAGAYEFNPETGNVISLLPIIGNYINDLTLSRETINQINRFFLHYLSRQFHKHIQLKSLQFYEQKQE